MKKEDSIKVLVSIVGVVVLFVVYLIFKGTLESYALNHENLAETLFIGKTILLSAVVISISIIFTKK